MKFLKTPLTEATKTKPIIAHAVWVSTPHLGQYWVIKLPENMQDMVRNRWQLIHPDYTSLLNHVKDRVTADGITVYLVKDNKTRVVSPHTDWKGEES